MTKRGVVLACVIATTSSCSNPKPPRLPSGAFETVQPGDVLRARVGGHATFEETIDVLPDGGADTACGHVMLQGKTTREVGSAIAACLVKKDVFVDAPAVVVSFTKRGSPPVIVVGPTHKRRVVTFDPKMTILDAIVQSLATHELPDRVTLHRRGGRYVIDVHAIAGGEQDDEPLELGDEIVIDKNLPIRPPPVEMVPIAGAPPSPDPTIHLDPVACADLRAERERLVAAGSGERHPLMVTVDAKLRSCP